MQNLLNETVSEQQHMNQFLLWAADYRCVAQVELFNQHEVLLVQLFVAEIATDHPVESDTRCTKRNYAHFTGQNEPNTGLILQARINLNQILVFLLALFSLLFMEL